LFASALVWTNLGCCLAGNGKVKSVLDGGVKIFGYWGVRIVINTAFGKNVGDLLVDTPLTCPD
jgi:hypothetical protein